MADLYGTAPSSNTDHAYEPQEISSFLHHFLHNSSSSSSSSSPCVPFKTKYTSSISSPPPPETTTSAVLVDRHRLGRLAVGSESGFRVDLSSGFNYSDPGGYFPVDVKESTENTFSSAGVVDSDANTSSKRRVVSGENDLGYFSCDSEKGPDVSEVPLNPVLPRNSSKRSRAAEVHNLSEKRRRSRINEKMKALQNLIPNSNKTDKASMLDEAIEYLKQLQLQVQMLSMRNGLSLHPMCLPGVLQPMQLPLTGMGFDEGNSLLHANCGTGAFSVNQETLLQTAFNLSNECTPTNQPIASMTKITNSETLFGFEPSTQAHYGTFNPSSSSKELCGEDTLPQMQSDMNCSEKNLTSGVS